jgi:hypothetical protein
VEDNIQIIAAINDLIDSGDQGDTWDVLREKALAIKALVEGQS